MKIKKVEFEETTVPLVDITPEDFRRMAALVKHAELIDLNEGSSDYYSDGIYWVNQIERIKSDLYQIGAQIDRNEVKPEGIVYFEKVFKAFITVLEYICQFDYADEKERFMYDNRWQVKDEFTAEGINKKIKERMAKGETVFPF